MKIIHIAMIVWIALKLVPLLFFKYIVNPMLFVQTINKVHPLFHFIMQLSQNHFVSIHFKMIQKGIIMPHSIQVEEKTVNGVTLIVRTAGLDNDGELILFLHGFPENATMWDPALIHMAKKGYRCIAPNQRGYSKTARFSDISNYRSPNMVADAFALVEAYGADQFHLVGHDWGSVISWRMVLTNPKPILSFTAMSTPHPAAQVETIAENPEQRKRSQYMWDFLQPDFVDKMLADDAAILRGYYADMPKEMIDAYVDFFDYETMTAAVSWYRIWLSDIKNTPKAQATVPPVDSNVKIIYGINDQYTLPDNYERGKKHLTGYNVHVPLEADHWLIEMVPDLVIAEIEEHVTRFSKNK